MSDNEGWCCHSITRKADNNVTKDILCSFRYRNDYGKERLSLFLYGNLNMRNIHVNSALWILNDEDVISVLLFHLLTHTRTRVHTHTHTNTERICNTCCFSMATMVLQTCLITCALPLLLILSPSVSYPSFFASFFFVLTALLFQYLFLFDSDKCHLYTHFST
jgi:hypothetical protein